MNIIRTSRSFQWFYTFYLKGNRMKKRDWKACFYQYFSIFAVFEGVYSVQRYLLCSMKKILFFLSICMLLVACTDKRQEQIAKVLFLLNRTGTSYDMQNTNGRQYYLNVDSLLDCIDTVSYTHPEPTRRCD